MKKLLILCILLVATNAYASRAVTLPWELTFDNNSWIADLARTECGGTSTHVTAGCYSGGCMKVTPPSAACAGGGVNGGATGLGWVTYPNTNRIHIRFLIKFGPTFPSSVRNAGGNLESKFILLDSPSRIGLLGLIGSDTDGRYLAWAAYGNLNVWTFRNQEPVWIEYAPFRIKDGVRTGAYTDVSKSSSGGSTGFWMSYFNSYGVANEGNWYLIDNLAVSTTYIGPPQGFTGGQADIIEPPKNIRVMQK
jgi:hypothetical protein